MEDEITICKGDTVALRTGGSGSFVWTPTNNISSTITAAPLVFPTATTTYRVALNDSKCTNTDSVVVNVLPRDSVQIQNVLPVCEGDSLRLSASSNAKVVQWLPEDFINDSKSFTPLVYPLQTMLFKVIANPGMCQTEDEVTVTVLNRPHVDAGHDLLVREEQSIGLNASGADSYHWWPATALNNTTIPNPILTVPIGVDSFSYIVEGRLANGCMGKDLITIRVNVVPLVDVPSAFTPNADNKNDVFRPIIKGGYQLEEFVVYNRWGQLLYQTTVAGKGWNGYVGTLLSPTGVYVWMVRARNKTTNAIVAKKGTVMLIH
jgi:gliding motility-associated-like protein